MDYYEKGEAYVRGNPKEKTNILYAFWKPEEVPEVDISDEEALY